MVERFLLLEALKKKTLSVHTQEATCAQALVGNVPAPSELKTDLGMAHTLMKPQQALSDSRSSHSGSFLTF